ncbi:MAG: hypothetical protein WD342_19855, partial [Verrucomicrobiales bacterium]
KGGGSEGVTNMGRINAIGGDVFLLGKTVTNSGSISASGGTVGLAAGEEVLLAAEGNAAGERMFVRATGSGASGTGVLNDGTIEGAAVELKAHGNMYALAINNKGSIRATGANHSGGKVFLKGAGGTVENSGSIRARMPDYSRTASVLIEAAHAKMGGRVDVGGAHGGEVRVVGTEVAEVSGTVDAVGTAGDGGGVTVESERVSIGSTAEIDASGTANGGSLRIGGGFQGQDATVANAAYTEVAEGAQLRADATGAGDGGEVVIWADGDTDFRGNISAAARTSGDGGFVEVSGKGRLGFAGTVSTLGAGGGSTGTLLLDPNDVEINDSSSVATASLIAPGAITTALGSNNVVISTNGSESDSGDIFVNADLIYDEGNNLSFLATRDIRANANVQNAGGGDVNLVAGWDESTGVAGSTEAANNPNADDADISAIESAAAFGLDAGSGAGAVFIGDGAQTGGISVGSRGGVTNVLGHGVEVAAGEAYAHVGYRQTAGGDDAGGAIAVRTREGGLLTTTGTQNNAYALIGHGGTGLADADHVGNISIDTTFGAADGAVILRGGISDGAQQTWTQIGHGGLNTNGSQSGDIEVIGGDIELGRPGDTGTDRRDSYAHVGHGGKNADGAKSGAITVVSSGSVSLQAAPSGSTAGSNAQIGHGGENTAGAADGDITIQIAPGGGLDILGGNRLSYAQVGHGGRARGSGDLSGDIRIEGASNVTISGGIHDDTYAQLGHGGIINGSGDFSGLIDLSASGNVAITGGGGQGANHYARVGHGGVGADGNHSGNIVASIGGDLQLLGGQATGRYASAQVGHGGQSSNGDHEGDILLTVAGGVSVEGGDDTTGDSDDDRTYAQIGHGGFDADGAHSGAIVLEAVGDVDLIAGTGEDAWAQIGHGGRNDNVGANSGDIFITTTVGGIHLTGGHGGAGYNVRSYGQIGHGGYNTDGDHSGDITLVSGDDVATNVGGQIGNHDNNYKQIGHGGRLVDGHLSGAINVAAVNDIDLIGGINDLTYAQIGHGGTDANGSATADIVGGGAAAGINVTSASGRIMVRGGRFGQSQADGRRAYAQIGLGGFAADGDFEGDITVSAADGLFVQGGGRDHNYALIGHGGDLSDGTKSGSIDITVTSGDATITGGQNQEFTAAQIGHGGSHAEGAATGAIALEVSNGSITVRSGGGGDDVDLSNSPPGTESYSFAQIGHGGAEGGNFDRSGTIDVLATGSVTLDADDTTGDRAYVQIGHGGYETAGDFAGDIEVGADSGNLEVIAGSQGGEGRYAKIGHGAYRSPGDVVGEIALEAGGDVSLIGGANENSFAQIGHGGILAAGALGGPKGWVTGDITLDADGDLRVLGGAGDQSFSLLGHGGLFSRGFYDGEIFATVGGGVEVQGADAPGTGIDNFAQIGHSLQGAFSGFGGFTEIDGRIVVDAISYSTNADGNWTVVPAEGGPFPDPDGELFANARGGIYLQARPGTGSNHTLPQSEVRAVTYEFEVLTPGTFVFVPRWTGYSGASDSMYADVVELKGPDHADWYQYAGAGGNNGDFGDPAWFDYALPESTSGGVSTAEPPATWTFNTAGTYTLRINPREDGVALDAFVFQDASEPTPTGLGPGATYANRSGSNSNITVLAQGDIAIGGGLNDGAHAAIGHGGSRIENVGVRAQYGSATDGANITVRSGGGDIELNGGDDPAGGLATGRYAAIGHHGTDSDFDAHGDIEVEGGNASLIAGTHRGNGAQIGHGGDGVSNYEFTDTVSPGVLRGAVDLTAAGDVSLTGGTAVSGSDLAGSARIGHGGDDNESEKEGDVSVVADGAVSLVASASGEDGEVRIGHGGVNTPGALSGAVTVVGDAGIELRGGAEAGNSAQIGHGTNDFQGAISGDITLGSAGGDLELAAGTGAEAFALVGHGGIGGYGFRGGEIVATIDGGVTLGGGAAGENSFTQIGHSLHGAQAGFGPFTIQSGRLVFGAEYFDSADSWAIVPTESPGDPSFFSNARGDIYVQSPFGGGGSSPATNNGAILYEIEITEAGTYQFFPRWTGADSTSDSIHVDIVELKDGTGGDIADWYEFTGGGNGDFASPSWHTNGGFELNAATVPGADPPAEWTFDTPGTYTLRVVPRESGAALDAFVFQREDAGLANPSGFGPVSTFANRSGTGGSVTVNAGGDVALSGGTESGTHAAIGHGGSFLDNQGGNIFHGAAADFADVTVTTSGGDVRLGGGAGGTGDPTGRYAAIGHHGAQADFNAFGNVVVEGGGVTLQGGDGAGSGAQIGHGGSVSTDFRLNDIEGPTQLLGDIDVMARNAIGLTGGTTVSGSPFGGSARIGHGGAFESEVTMTLDGHLCVVAGDGIVLDASTGDAIGAYTQIGHGGINIVGDKSGDVAVTSGTTGTGGVALTGGSAFGEFAQIGHGGVDSSGDMSGDLSVVADNGGAIALQGGTGASNYAMIGHGDGGGATTTGTRQGGVRIFAAGNLSATDGGVANTSVFHQTNGGLDAADYLGGNGFQLVGNGTVSFSDGALNGVNTMIDAHYASGPLSFAFSNDIDIVIGAGQDRIENTSDNFLMATGGSITLLSSHQNAGSGAITYVAGWDGSDSLAGGSVTFNGGDFCDPSISGPDAGIDFNNCGSFGNGDAMLVVGDSDQAAPVRIGSQDGTTTLAAHGLTMEAGTSTINTSTQVGFYGDGSGPASGAIRMHLQAGGLSMTSGGSGAFTQIGHGGWNSVNGNVEAEISISFCEPGDLAMSAGDGARAYSQIGHGGFDKEGFGRGDLTITGARDVDVLGGSSTHAYAQIGHGGILGDGDHRGAITLEATGDVRFDATTGTATNAYVQIGHGGGNAVGNFDGAVSVTAGIGGSGGIEFLAGGSSNQFAQIGHGGRSGDGNRDGNLTVTAADTILVRGGTGARSYAKIGHGGHFNAGSPNGGNTGAIHLESTQGDVHFQWSGIGTNAGTESYVQLGHGGLHASGDQSGDITVLAHRNVRFQSIYGATTSRNLNFIQLGHGGANASGDHSGNITVLADTGSLSFLSGTRGGGDRSAQLGHGGLNAAGNHSGDIAVLAQGAITFDSLGTNTDNARSYSQLGHGGHNADSTLGHSGRIGVASRAGTITFQASPANTAPALAEHSYSQLGHGGYDAAGAHNGDIVVRAGNQLLFGGGVGGGEGSYAQLGHGGMMDPLSGDPDGDLSGSITVSSQIAGSFDDIGDFDGDDNFDNVSLAAGGSGTSIRFAGGGSASAAAPSSHHYAQLGHGGTNRGGNFGTAGDIIEVAALRDVDFLAGAGIGDYAQLGHGGLGGSGNLRGSIDAVAGGAFSLQGGNATDAFALVGHGGVNRSGTLGATGEIVRVDGQSGVNVLGGGGTRTFTQIGHGGFGGSGTLRGDVFVNADPGTGATTGGGAVLVYGGSGSNAHAQIGLGGTRSSTQIGTTAVHGDSVEVKVGGGGTSYARIGTGGGVNNTATSTTGTTVVANDGGVLLDARGGGGNAYAQIGSGGLGGGGNVTGVTEAGSTISTTVAATGAVEVLGGSGNNASAMIGVGGAGRNGIKTDAGVRVTGESVLVEGSTGGGAFAKIGSGGGRTSAGNVSVGPVDGDIEISTTTGGVVLNGGSSRGFAQIGHGGINFSGNITGDINLVASGSSSLTSGNHVDGYALVGHGGAGASGDFAGEICFHSADGLTLDSSGSSYTQIGHGGRNANVDSLSGTVSVTALGDISVAGGGSANAYAQIGHGGINTDAPMSGDLYVIADNGSDLVVSGGSGSDAYAMLGHGDGVGTIGVEDSGTSSGTRQGGIQYFAGGDLTVAHGSGGNSYLHHRTNTGGGLEYPSTYLGGSGYQIVSNGSSSIAAGALEGLDAMVDGNIGVGHIVISIQDDVDYTYDGPDVYFDNDFDFIIMTGGNIEMLADYQNAGRGRGILVAGWDGNITSPATVDLTDFCAPVIRPGTINFNNCDAFGNNGGTVTLGSAGQTEAVRFGSREGLTAVAGHGVTMNASTGTSGAGTQIGFYGDGSGDITGEILVRAKAGGLTMNSGTTGAYTQIGHGGSGSVGAAIDAPVTISFCEPGDVTLNGGTGTDAYAQIGHGGRGVTGTRAGDIEILGSNGSNAGAISLNSGSGTHAYSQIGHGGLATGGGSGATRGSIRIESNASVELTGGAGQDAYSQIGLGGHDNNANHGVDGDRIVVIADEGFSLIGGDTVGSSYGAYAQIGQGGYDADGTLTGDISLNYDPDAAGGAGAAAGGGDIVLLASTKTTTENNFGTVAQIGHGGRNMEGVKFGDIVIGAADNVSVTGALTHSYAQIGHGGNGSPVNGAGNATGEIRIEADGDLTVQGGGGTNGAYGQIGHGGHQYNGQLVGGIDLSFGGGAEVLGGSATQTYSQIGHGGFQFDGTATGNVALSLGGTLDVLGGTGTDTYAHIGHGGALASGEVVGSAISVDAAGSIELIAGAAPVQRAYAQIGHGGYQALEFTAMDSDILINTAPGSGGGAVLVQGGGVNAHAQIGHGGARTDGTRGDGDSSASGDILLGASSSVTVQGGDNTDGYAQIGHGGEGHAGTHSGNIELHSAGDISLTGGGGGSHRQFAMIGHGGFAANAANNAGAKSGDITLDADGSVSLSSGTGTSSFAQVGHGGDGSGVDLSGAITVASGADIALQSPTTGYAQIGHGGNGSGDSNVVDSTIQVDAVGAIDLQSSDTGTFFYTQIGHGGANSNAMDVINSDILVNTLAGSGTADITVQAGAGSNAYAQIGHGGARSDGSGEFGDREGDIVVGAAANIAILGSTNTDSYAQIGHGGEGGNRIGSGATLLGDIELATSGDLEIIAGGGTDAYAQIGHGGENSAVNRADGDITLAVGGGTTLGGGTITRAYAQIGHGGSRVTGDSGASFLTGDIFLNIDPDTLAATGGGGDIVLAGGTGSFSSAQIGHGGDTGNAAAEDSIVVFTLGQVSLEGGDGSNAWTQIGHGGRSKSGNQGDTGDIIAVIGGNGVELLGGGTNGFAHIGNGGLQVEGDTAGDVVVNFDPINGVPLGGGDVALRGGTGTASFVQIGHGGIDALGTKSGDFVLGSATALVLDGGNADQSYAQIGHGGIGAIGNKSGDLVLSGISDVQLGGGAADRTYALIGHGGIAADGYLDGNISLDASGDLDLDGGSGESTFAMIGHSLQDARGGFGGLLERDGLIVGEAEFFDSTDDWVIRQEGYFPAGWTGSAPPQSFLDNGFTGSRNGYFIDLPDGNGGGQASNNNFALYNFTTTTGGSYRLSTRWTGFNGNSDSLFADIVEIKDGIGSGEADFYQFAGGGSNNGVFDWLSVATTEASTGGAGSDAPVWNLDPNTTYTLRFNPREDGVAVDSWMLVHDTATFDGDAGVTFANASGIRGSVEVSVGADINLESGSGNDAHTAIGHGGGNHLSQGGLSYGAAADQADIDVSAGGGISLNGGSGAANQYAVIGHHGVNATFDAFGRVSVATAGGGLGLVAGNGVNSHAQVGHSSGGSSFGAQEFTGDIDISVAGGIRLSGSAGEAGHAQIGHGGNGVNGDKDGEVNVEAVGYSLAAGNGDGSYVQVGHGGDGSDGNSDGDLVATATGAGPVNEVALVAGDGQRAYALIGHGGVNSSGARSGAVTLEADSLEMSAGGGEDAFALVGHGGTMGSGSLDGDLSVTLLGALAMEGGLGTQAFAQIGHGGFSMGGAKSGELTVSGGTVDLLAGDGL